MHVTLRVSSCLCGLTSLLRARRRPLVVLYRLLLALAVVAVATILVAVVMMVMVMMVTAMMLGMLPTATATTVVTIQGPDKEMTSVSWEEHNEASHLVWL